MMTEDLLLFLKMLEARVTRVEDDSGLENPRAHEECLRLIRRMLKELSS
jgi:hypothetical protein